MSTAKYLVVLSFILLLGQTSAHGQSALGRTVNDNIEEYEAVIPQSLSPNAAGAEGGPPTASGQNKCPGVNDEPEGVGNEPCAAEVVRQKTDFASTPDVRFPYVGVIRDSAHRAAIPLRDPGVQTAPGYVLPGIVPVYTAPGARPEKKGGDQ